MSPRAPRFPLGLASVIAASKPALRKLGAQRPADANQAQARRDATPRSRGPSGFGLDSARVRACLVERLRADGHGHAAVLNAIGSVPRHQFVDTALVAQAYEDTALPIGLGQTISKPGVIARMLALLFDGQNARAANSLGNVLEIGTGCGYQVALLACLSRQVVSVERLRALHEKARENLSSLRQDKMRLVFGDGTLGHAPNAPYDSVIAAAGGDEVPPAWLEQLAVGGRLIAPVRHGSGHALVVIDRTESGWQRSVHDPVRFVPLISGTGA